MREDVPMAISYTQETHGAMTVEPSFEDWIAISRSSLFSKLDRALMRGLMAEDSILTFSKGDVICVQNEPARYCHVVLGGLVKLTRRTPVGQQAVISIHGPSQTFMEADALSKGVYSTTAEAIVDSRILRIEAEALREKIGADPPFALAMLASASLHLKILLEHVEKLKSMTGPARLADFLLGLVQQRAGHAAFVLPYEKQLIASHLGMTPESFSRALGQLRGFGVHAVRNKIEIEDIQRLRQFRDAR